MIVAWMLAAAPAQGITPAELERALGSLPVPELRAQDLGSWRPHLRPSEAELAFERIDWIPELASGLARASREGRPLFLWAMNGHPLGCT